MASAKFEAGMLPDWPALMSAEMASRYLSLDENSFAIVCAAAGAHPIDLGLDLRRWRRRDLDKLVSALLLKLQAPPMLKPTQGALDEDALERLVLRVQEKISVQRSSLSASPRPRSSSGSVDQRSGRWSRTASCARSRSGVGRSSGPRSTRCSRVTQADDRATRARRVI